MFVQDFSTFDVARKVDLSGVLNMEQDGLATIGLIAETLVETCQGWRRAGDLAVGDAVFTYDGGARTIQEIDRAYLDAASLDDGLVHVPGGVLNNCNDLTVLPDQHLLVEHGAVNDVMGRMACLIAARDLVGFLGITQSPATSLIETMRPIFRDEEVIWANTGVLFHCPDAASGGTDFFATADRGQARSILALIGWEQQAAA